MKKKSPFLKYHFLVIGVICLLLISSFSTTFAQEKMLDKNSSKTEALNKFIQAFDYINKSYIDSVDTDKLIEAALNAILGELDPHSIYIPPDHYSKMREPLQGSFIGIGIQFHLFEDTILVTNVLKNGPADQKGVKAGDKILKINEEVVTGVRIAPEEITEKFKGDNNELVNIEVLNRKKKLKTLTVPLERVSLNSIDLAYMPAPGVGYIRLNRFSASTMKEFRGAIKDFKTKNFENLILDLRGNGGGYLNVAFELANQFLNKGELIVYTEGLNYNRKNYVATSKGGFVDGKLIVLIDEGSASASEIVAGAIQDWDRGLLIGRRSFGKGLVQKPFSLPDGSVMRLTIANYRTPSGRSIQKSYEKGRESYYQDITSRYKRGEMIDESNINFADSLTFFTKNERRAVYGGGGIMPDLFMPIDTITQTVFFQQLISPKHHFLRDFLLGYLEVEREKILKKYRTIDEFEANFEVSKDLMEDLYVFLIENDLDVKLSLWESSQKAIKNQITVRLGGYLWDNAAYYRLKNKTDISFLKALEVFESQKPITYFFNKEAIDKELEESDNPYATGILKLKPSKVLSPLTKPAPKSLQEDSKNDFKKKSNLKKSLRIEENAQSQGAMTPH